MRTAKNAPKGWLSFIRTLARDSKLKIVVGHNVGPATNGKVMWLPALPAELTPDDLVLFEGNAFHEVGHIQRSNIKFFQAFGKEHGSFAGFLLNALDDVFMEGRQAAWKKMAANRLLDSTMLLIKRGQFRDGSAGLGEAVACYCLAYLTAKRWPSVGVATVRVEGNLRKHLAQHADKVIPELRNLLDAEFPAVASTEDGGALALKIIELLQSLAEQEQSQPSNSPESGDSDDDAEGTSESANPESDDDSDSESNPQGEGKGAAADDESEPQSDDAGQGNGQNSEADPKGEDDEKGGSGTDAEPQGDDKGQGDESSKQSSPKSNDDGVAGGESGNAGSKAEQGDESNEGEGNQGKDGESQSEPGAEADNGKSLKEMVESMLNENLGNQEVFDKGSALKELAGSIASGENPAYEGQPLVNGLVIDYSVGAGKSEGFADGMPIVTADREMATAIAQVTGRKANVMGNRLRALLANREETESYAARTGQLSDRALYRFALNDSKVFAKAEERIEETAAVSITADLSGSTGIQKEGSSIAEQIRIALSMLDKVLHEIGTPREILGFAPASGELNCMVKSFGDNHRVAMDRIAGMHRLVGGNSTPIGSAVLQAGSRLLSHEAQRKLLLVVTDGLPDDAQHAVEMTSTIQRNGAEVIFLVIGAERTCDWLKAANIKFARAENAEGLIPAMVSKMAEFLA